MMLYETGAVTVSAQVAVPAAVTDDDDDGGGGDLRGHGRACGGR